MLSRISIKYFKMAVGLNAIGKETDVDISARCPVCGDSRTNKHMKRLHLYNKGLEVDLVNCYNGSCPVENKPVYVFLRDHFPHLLDAYKRETFTDTLNELSRGDVFSSGKQSTELESSLALDWESSEIAESHNPENSEIKVSKVHPLDLTNHIAPIKNSEKSLAYIESRGFPRNLALKEKYGKWYYGYQDLRIDGIVYRVCDNIIIPLYNEYDEMYGFYARSIEDKFFCTFMQDINIGYKIWNWFKVDKSKPVYIFEGIFDALASGKENIIALMGAKLPTERLAELKEPVFCLDNDSTGLKNSLSYSQLDQNIKVFLFPEGTKDKDMNAFMQNNPLKNIPEMIDSNLYQGIMSVVVINSRL